MKEEEPEGEDVYIDAELYPKNMNIVKYSAEIDSFTHFIFPNSCLKKATMQQ